MKKTLLVILALILALSTFVSCNGNNKNPEGTQPSSDETGDTIASALGFESENNNFDDFNVLLNNSEGAFNMALDFYAEEADSDVVSKQVLARNHACEEYLGITINYHREPGNWNSGMPQKIYTLVSGGSSEYDMVVMGLNTGIMGGYVSIYQNVLEMDYVDTDHSWWVQEIEEMVSINNRLVFLTGDACLSTYAYLGCVFANLTVAENYTLFEDGRTFYDLVNEDQWTMETFFSMFQEVGLDQMGDGTYDPKVDTFGWANIQTSVRVMWSSCDMNLIIRNEEDGSFVVRPSLDDTILRFMTDIRTACEDKLSIHFTQAETETAVNAFVNDRCLFASYYVYLAQDFKANNMESLFAVLPLPKYNAQQEDYISTNISAYNALFFPATIKNPALSAKVAEFMGYYGQKNVVPAYYDENLKLRNNDVGQANVEMLDLIRDKLRVTPNELYGTIGDIIGLTPTTEKNMSSTGFYYSTTTIWGEKYNTFNDGVANYIYQYYR